MYTTKSNKDLINVLLKYSQDLLRDTVPIQKHKLKNHYRSKQATYGPIDNHNQINNSDRGTNHR